MGMLAPIDWTIIIAYNLMSLIVGIVMTRRPDRRFFVRSIHTSV
jgi:hypothetical protein